jgi:hypothetical protein
MLWARADDMTAAPAAASPTETKIFFILLRVVLTADSFPHSKKLIGRLPDKFIRQARTPSKHFSVNYRRSNSHKLGELTPLRHVAVAFLLQLHP